MSTDPVLTEQALLTPIESDCGSLVGVSEASDPHVRLGIVMPAGAVRTTGALVNAALNLTTADALRLADQLKYIVENHSQNLAELSADQVVHVVGNWQYLLDRFGLKIPRALCGELLVSGVSEDKDLLAEAMRDAPTCAACRSSRRTSWRTTTSTTG